MTGSPAAAVGADDRLPAWLAVGPEEPGGWRLVLALLVVPGASRRRVLGAHGDRLRVAVTAPPEAGKANRQVTELLAEAVGVPPRQVRVVRGSTSRVKDVEVIGVGDRAAVVARLTAAAG